ncbi:hypothetical protein WOLCODRAFT_166748 [Wolfiporia cocos MD-104 SS10]|uniref:Uncharacterized protein n=1 Tax=Wolfiporia cocos (strain MD-104) TaxID=742152 RepID=A0A2H3JBU7_WOLCO|nr:hypothetical protein WOLCODRAFT_166748 [Wolfiporia cocos MD-104 SS10]
MARVRLLDNTAGVWGDSGAAPRRDREALSNAQATAISRPAGVAADFIIAELRYCRLTSTSDRGDADSDGSNGVYLQAARTAFAPILRSIAGATGETRALGVGGASDIRGMRTPGSLAPFYEGLVLTFDTPGPASARRARPRWLASRMLHPARHSAAQRGRTRARRGPRAGGQVRHSAATGTIRATLIRTARMRPIAPIVAIIMPACCFLGVFARFVRFFAVTAGPARKGAFLTGRGLLRAARKASVLWRCVPGALQRVHGFPCGPSRLLRAKFGTAAQRRMSAARARGGGRLGGRDVTHSGKHAGRTRRVTVLHSEAAGARVIGSAHRCPAARAARGLAATKGVRRTGDARSEPLHVSARVIVIDDAALCGLQLPGIARVLPFCTGARASRAPPPPIAKPAGARLQLPHLAEAMNPRRGLAAGADPAPDPAVAVLVPRRAGHRAPTRVGREEGLRRPLYARHARAGTPSGSEFDVSCRRRVSGRTPHKAMTAFQNGGAANTTAAVSSSQMAMCGSQGNDAAHVERRAPPAHARRACPAAHHSVRSNGCTPAVAQDKIAASRIYRARGATTRPAHLIAGAAAALRRTARPDQSRPPHAPAARARSSAPRALLGVHSGAHRAAAGVAVPVTRARRARREGARHARVSSIGRGDAGSGAVAPPAASRVGGLPGRGLPHPARWVRELEPAPARLLYCKLRDEADPASVLFRIQPCTPPGQARRTVGRVAILGLRRLHDGASERLACRPDPPAVHPCITYVLRRANKGPADAHGWGIWTHQPDMSPSMQTTASAHSPRAINYAATPTHPWMPPRALASALHPLTARTHRGAAAAPCADTRDSRSSGSSSPAPPRADAFTHAHQTVYGRDDASDPPLDIGSAIALARGARAPSPRGALRGDRLLEEKNACVALHIASAGAWPPTRIAHGLRDARACATDTAHGDGDGDGAGQALRPPGARHARALGGGLVNVQTQSPRGARGDAQFARGGRLGAGTDAKRARRAVRGWVCLRSACGRARPVRAAISACGVPGSIQNAVHVRTGRVESDTRAASAASVSVRQEDVRARTSRKNKKRRRAGRRRGRRRARGPQALALCFVLDDVGHRPIGDPAR